MKKDAVGKWGEIEAQKLLSRKGYTVMETNYRTSFGEVDIICRKKNVLVFVEVKTRSDNGYGNPEETISKKQIQHYFNVAKYYVLKKKLINMDVRFDVVVALRDNVRHIENAFDASSL